MTTTIGVDGGMEVHRGTDAARENGRDLRFVVGIGAGTETAVPDGKAPQLKVDEKALPTRQHHEARPTILVSVARPRQASLSPKMLKPLSLHKPKPRVINRRNDLLNLRLGRRGPLQRSRRRKRAMPQAHESSLPRWMAELVALRLP